MQNKKSILSAIFLFGLGISLVKAQSTISASGNNGSGSGGTVSYTVGQVVYSTINGSNGQITQGVQQPYEISVVTGVEEAKDITLEFIVYPNPATDYIKLKIKNFELENLSYQLYDISGAQLKTDIINSNENTISMQDIRASTYFLKVLQGRKEIKTFKIIKN
jgi:hypothetical protein